MPAMKTPTLAHAKLSRADRIGAWAGTACAIHCGLTPLALALMPALGGWLVAGEAWHLGFLGFLTLLALTTTMLGWRRHRRFYAWAFLVPGLMAIWLGHTWFEQQEAIFTAVGGTLVVCAHVVNLKLAHGHVHDAACSHTHSH